VDDQVPAPITNSQVMEIPAFKKSPALAMDMGNIRSAESRIIEAKTVNPITYVDLEHSFNQSYRDLKKYLSAIGYHITLAEKAMEEAKANVLLDTYPEFLKSNDMKKTQDNADLRKAFLMRDVDYLAALDRFNQLQALNSNFEGKLKVMERVCAYMKVQMQIVLRSGLSNSDYYATSGKR
jgi:hypothetical protein